MTTAALLEADFVLPPFEHQMREFEFHSDDAARAWAWTMRTGKTKEAIDRACHLYIKRNKIDGVLIFAPIGVHANWTETEWPKHKWPGFKSNVLTWRTSELSVKAKNKLSAADAAAFEVERAAWFAKLKNAKHTSNLMVLAVPSDVMTRDDIRKAVAFFIDKRRVLVIFDESDDFGIPGTKRTKMARALARRCPFRIIMTGTMLTATPLAAFSQFELLEKAALGFSKFEDFKAYFADYEIEVTRGGRHYPKLKNFKNLDELQRRMSRFMSVVLRDDVKDMPALNMEEREVIATEEQLRVYRDLHKSIMVEIGRKEISIGELAQKIGKLQQVFSGFLIDEFKDVHKIPGRNPRLDLLAREVFLSPGKVIVWCQFQQDIDWVIRRLKLEGHKVVEYHGRVSGQAKSDSLRTFRNNRDVKALVGHAKSGGRGQDMSAAAKIIWYSHTFSARIREQALERATAIGGGNVNIVDFVGAGPDRYMLDVTSGRVRIADEVAGRGMKKLLEGLAL